MSELRILDETSLSSVYRHWTGSGFGIVTAWRQNKTRAENVANMERLKSTVKRAGFGWVPIAGRWKEEGGKLAEEPAIFIPAVRRDGAADPAGLRALVVDLGRTFEQDAVVWSGPNGATEIIFSSGHVERKSSFHPTDAGAIFSGLTRRPGAFYFESLVVEPRPRGWSEALAREALGEIWPVWPA